MTGEPSPDQLRTLAGRFDTQIGGVYGYVAAALRQQAHDRHRDPLPPIV